MHIDLKKTVEAESAMDARVEKDAYDRACLDREIREILEQRRKVAVSLNEPL